MDNNIRKKKILLFMVIALCAKKKARIKKKFWCKDWLQRRQHLGSHATILRELKNESDLDFKNYMRMDPNTFYNLLSKLEPTIRKQDTNMRQSISAEARLHATLLYLSTGCNYTALQYTTRISKQSLCKIIPETCRQIYEVLRKEYLKVIH